MVCTYCGAKTEVINSRVQKRSNQVWRRRQCQRCSALFTSHEAVDLSSVLFIDQKPFVADKLFTEVLLAMQDRSDCYLRAREATSTIVKQLLKLTSAPFIEAPEVSQTAAKVLKRLDKQAYLRYQVEHPSLQN